jgi:hypothetical protein
MSRRRRPPRVSGAGDPRHLRGALYANTCTGCDRDLVYVDCVCHENGPPIQDRWVTPWFGCDCPDRPRLRGEDTWQIVDTGRRPRERLEPWGRLSYNVGEEPR